MEYISLIVNSIDIFCGTIFIDVKYMSSILKLNSLSFYDLTSVVTLILLAKVFHSLAFVISLKGIKGLIMKIISCVVAVILISGCIYCSFLYANNSYLIIGYIIPIVIDGAIAELVSVKDLFLNKN